jgi:hypothetical protein
LKRTGQQQGNTSRTLANPRKRNRSETLNTRTLNRNKKEGAPNKHTVFAAKQNEHNKGSPMRKRSNRIKNNCTTAGENKQDICKTNEKKQKRDDEHEKPQQE